MGRKKGSYRRERAPDSLYDNALVSKFINVVMWDGKKNLARKTVYSAIELLAKKLNKEPLEAFLQAIENAKPTVEVIAKRVGGFTRQVPSEVRPARRLSLALRWIVQFSRKKSKKMVYALFEELLGCYENSKQSGTIKKKEEVYRNAQANLSSLPFRG